MSGVGGTSAAPQLRHATTLAEHGIARGHWHFPNGGQRLVAVGSVVAAAQIVCPLRRVGADDKKIAAAGKPLMSGTGGQNGDVAGGKLKCLAAWPAELHARMAAGDAEDLVNHRVIMHEGKDAVAPLAMAPAIAGEEG